MIETSSYLLRSSSESVRKCSENSRKRSSALRNNFGKSSEIFGKWSEIFGKSSKTSSVVCLCDKQNITCPLVDTNFIFSCSTRYLEDKIRIHAQACNILYFIELHHISTHVSSVHPFANNRRRINQSERALCFSYVINQYSNMASRLSGQASIFGGVLFVSKSLSGIGREKILKKITILTRKPWSHVTILLYRTSPIYMPVFQRITYPFSL